MVCMGKMDWGKFVMYFDNEEKPCDRVTFTNRLIIEKKFEEWCDKNSIAKPPMSMVSFMQHNNLIKIGSANEYAKRHKAILKK